jgi:hypothetical protein
MGAAKSLQTGANDARPWLHQWLLELIEYAQFTREFGAVSWKRCALDDARLEDRLRFTIEMKSATRERLP